MVDREEVSKLMSEIKGFLSAAMPATTYSHIKAFCERVDGFSVEIIQSINEISYVKSLLRKKIAARLAMLVDDHWADYKNRYMVESVSEGDPQLIDLRSQFSSFDISIVSLDQLGWVLKIERSK